MGKSVHNDVLDGALNIIKNNCTRMVACTTEPTTFAEADTGGAKNLADVTVASGDFTVADGSTSGRKVTVAAKSGVTIDASGTAQHVALLDVTNSKLLYVTTCASLALTSGQTVNFGSFAIEIQDPV